MGDAEGKINGDGMKCTTDVPCLKSETNGFGFRDCNDIAKGGSVPTESILTYKRRRRARSSWDSRYLEDWGADLESSSQFADQNLKEPVGTVLKNNSCERAHLRVNNSDTRSERKWKNSILENMYQYLGDDEGGVQLCIRQVLENFRGSDHTTRVKESGNEGQDRHQCCLPKPSLSSGPQNVANGHAGVASNGFSNKSNRTVTAMCQHAFYNVLVSEKFALLCKLLLENFEGIKADRIFDLSLINSRMKRGDYEHSPLLFSADMQQAWRKLQEIGADLVTLAKSLSDMSRSSYNEQVGDIVRDTFDGEQNEVCVLESDSHTKMEQAEDFRVHSVCTCRNCRGKADGRDCLVCDSCEEMYHVSCIEPALKKIPLKSWYCANCTANGVRSSHENCVVCEKLNVSKPVVAEIESENVSADEATVDEMWGSSNCSTDNGVLLSEESRDFNICKVCGNEVENGDKLRECGHQYCLKKYYHEECLTTKQLKSYGPVWYCYSCLCRRCLADKEDDLIVLCDGCDHAYHIYCMEPARTSIPTGKWFCRKCDAALKAIRMAKISYETKNQKQTRKRGGSRKLTEKADYRESERSRGGMEALLCAVNTLNNGED